jgi:hypothetical protein
MSKMIRMTAMPSAATCAALVLLATALQAQERPAEAETRPAPISLEIRGGYSLPVAALNDLGAQSDFGYGAQVMLRLSPSFGLYGGWGRDVFHCEDCTGDAQIRSSGVELGGKFIVPDRERAHPWVKGGLLASKSLLMTGTSQFEGSRNVGLQAAVGLDAPLSAMVSVSPSARFHSFTSEFDGVEGQFAGYQPRTDFRYFSFDLAAQIHLR